MAPEDLWCSLMSWCPVMSPMSSNVLWCCVASRVSAGIGWCSLGSPMHLRVREGVSNNPQHPLMFSVSRHVPQRPKVPWSLSPSQLSPATSQEFRVFPPTPYATLSVCPGVP